MLGAFCVVGGHRSPLKWSRLSAICPLFSTVYCIHCHLRLFLVVVDSTLARVFGKSDDQSAFGKDIPPSVYAGCKRRQLCVMCLQAIQEGGGRVISVRVLLRGGLFSTIDAASMARKSDQREPPIDRQRRSKNESQTAEGVKLESIRARQGNAAVRTNRRRSDGCSPREKRE